MNKFVFRTWPHDQTERLKELWWQGKSPADCCRILGSSSPRATYDKAMREGFVRDPRKLKPDPAKLLPVSRETGELVTMRNCTSKECRWPYDLPSADMVMCGRAADHGPYCEGHRAMAYLPNKPVAR